MFHCCLPSSLLSTLTARVRIQAGRVTFTVTLMFTRHALAFLLVRLLRSRTHMNHPLYFICWHQTNKKTEKASVSVSTTMDKKLKTWIKYSPCILNWIENQNKPFHIRCYIIWENMLEMRKHFFCINYKVKWGRSTVKTFFSSLANQRPQWV